MINRYRHLNHRWVAPIFSVSRFWRSLSLMRRYLSDWSTYEKLPGSEPVRFLDSYPCLYDRTPNNPIDPHYFYQSIWAFKLIKHSATTTHVDVGSLASFVGLLTAITEVTFVDIRPLVVDLENFKSIPGNILALPFDENSVRSLSCLHVAEHIGLGRYGDSLDALGTKKAARELVRVLAPRGNLFFSLPIGNPRVCFNAHRVHSPEQILSYFDDLKLVQFAAITDSGMYSEDILPTNLASQNYACGLFWFTKEL